MIEMKICRRCGAAFDWPGVQKRREEFCCPECARGEPCACAQHERRTETMSEKVSGSSGPE